jgi:hypothetical protein
MEKQVLVRLVEGVPTSIVALETFGKNFVRKSEDTTAGFWMIVTFSTTNLLV